MKAADILAVTTFTIITLSILLTVIYLQLNSVRSNEKIQLDRNQKIVEAVRLLAK